MQIKNIIFLALLAIIPFTLWEPQGIAADSTPKPKTQNQTWVKGTPPHVTVKLDSLRQHVDVTLKKDSAQVPQSIGITFFDEKGKPTSLELKAIDMLNDPAHYQGSFTSPFDINAYSHMGFEIQIPFGTGDSKKLKSSELTQLPSE